MDIEERVKCKDHGLKTITCSLAKKGNSTSNMLRGYIYEMNKILQEKYIAKYFGVCPDTVKRIDKEFIREKMKTRSLSPEIIGLDELSIGDGQTNYIHILSDIGDIEVVDIGEGRKQKDVDKTIESNKSVLGNVKFAVMDMWEAFANSMELLTFGRHSIQRYKRKRYKNGFTKPGDTDHNYQNINVSLAKTTGLKDGYYSKLYDKEGKVESKYFKSLEEIPKKYIFMSLL